MLTRRPLLRLSLPQKARLNSLGSELAAQRLDLDAVSNDLKIAHRFPGLSAVLCLCCVGTTGGPPEVLSRAVRGRQRLRLSAAT